MMKYALSVAALLAAPAAVQAAGAAPVQSCDLMAQHPADPNRITKGVDKKDMDLSGAVDACRAALKQYPDEPRFHYQLARALYYRGHAEDIAPAVESLAAASDRGYSQATFVLGYVYTLGDKVPRDMCRAGHLWKQSLAQGHPWTKFYMSQHWLSGDFASCSFNFSRGEIERHALTFLALGLNDKVDSRAKLVTLLEKK